MFVFCKRTFNKKTKATENCKTDKEIREKWNEIYLKYQSEIKKALTKKNTEFETIVKDGFRIEVAGVNKKNRSALKRATKLQAFTFNKHHRINFNKQISSGVCKPAFNFNATHQTNKKTLDISKNAQKNQTFKTHWGAKIPEFRKKAKHDKLQKWFYD